ncbi:MAG: hypothetical protein ACJA2E_001053 [Arenicella sp.]|jgi:hypothetical protein
MKFKQRYKILNRGQCRLQICYIHCSVSWLQLALKLIAQRISVINVQY